MRKLLPIAPMMLMEADVVLFAGSMNVVIAPVILGPSSFKATCDAEE